MMSKEAHLVKHLITDFNTLLKVVRAANESKETHTRIFRIAAPDSDCDRTVSSYVLNQITGSLVYRIDSATASQYASSE